MLSTIIIIVAILIVGALFMLKFLRNVQPDETEVAEDLVELKKMCAKFKGGLEPFSEEISSSRLDQVLEKGQARTGSGVFLSTLGQPIIAYAYRKYIGPSTNATIYVLTSEHEYVYRYTTKGAEITIDGKKQGILRENGKLYNFKNEEVATVERSGAISQNKILIDNKEVAKIALPDATAGIQAIQMQGEINAEQRTYIDILAVHELVTNLSEI